MRRTLLASTAVLVATLALAGCTASSGASTADQSGPAPALEGGDFSSTQGGTTQGGTTDSAAAAERQVIIAGDVTITADDPIAASREAVRIVEAAGGRVDGRTEYAPTAATGDGYGSDLPGADSSIGYVPGGSAGSATLELRIPADKLTATLDELEKLGRADQVSLSTSDVTVESQDLDARISALRSSLERIQALVAKATTIDDLIRLEGEVSSRQAELESLEAQQRYLADQVSMSTVTLYLRSGSEVPPIDPGDFWSGLATGWASFVGFWAGLLVVVGVLLPWIVTLALIAGAVILVLRRRRRVAAKTAASPAAAASPPQADEPISASSATP